MRWRRSIPRSWPGSGREGLGPAPATSQAAGGPGRRSNSRTAIANRQWTVVRAGCAPRFGSGLDRPQNVVVTRRGGVSANVGVVDGGIAKGCDAAAGGDERGIHCPLIARGDESVGTIGTSSQPRADSPRVTRIAEGRREDLVALDCVCGLGLLRALLRTQARLDGQRAGDIDQDTASLGDPAGSAVATIAADSGPPLPRDAIAAVASLGDEAVAAIAAVPTPYLILVKLTVTPVKLAVPALNSPPPRAELPPTPAPPFPPVSLTAVTAIAFKPAVAPVAGEGTARPTAVAAAATAGLVRAECTDRLPLRFLLGIDGERGTGGVEQSATGSETSEPPDAAIPARRLSTVSPRPPPVSVFPPIPPETRIAEAAIAPGPAVVARRGIAEHQDRVARDHGRVRSR